MGKGGGEHENIAKASDYSFLDPTGRFMSTMDQFGGMAQFGREGVGRFTDPNMAFNAFMGQSPGLANMAQGATAPLTQSLNALAARQAEQGVQAAAQQFNAQGAGRSGAANRAMGEAAFMPFAQAQAQIAGEQLGLTGSLWGQALQNAAGLQRAGLGTFGNIYGQGMQGLGQMASETGGMMAPQYAYQPTGWEQFTGGVGDIVGIGADAATMYSGFKKE